MASGLPAKRMATPFSFRSPVSVWELEPPSPPRPGITGLLPSIRTIRSKRGASLSSREVRLAGTRVGPVQSRRKHCFAAMGFLSARSQIKVRVRVPPEAQKRLCKISTKFGHYRQSGESIIVCRRVLASSLAESTANQKTLRFMPRTDNRFLVINH